MLSNLGIELIVCHSPGWYDSTGHGNIGTSHMDMVMLTVAGLHCATLELVRDQADE